MKKNQKKMVAIISKAIVSNKVTRNLAAKKFDKILYKEVLKRDDPLYSKKAKIYRYQGLKALYLSYLKNINKGIISKKVSNKIIETLVKGAMFSDEGQEKIKERFRKEHNQNPPSFFVLSPSKRCNLHCKGCYASSTSSDAQTLDWQIVDKIMTEAHDSLGMRFFVISGGEPLMYKSGEKTILDLPKKWKDSYFLMYTNGTLIDENIAKQMAELGNITPAISVEGYEEHTDKRRGKGVHKKILKAADNLKKVGVPFGTSVTVTKENIDIMLDNHFYDYYFDEIGCTYMWMFHYMPIGRDFTTNLMITPEQRLKLFEKQRHIFIDKEWFVADFWNSAIMSKGCISSSRSGGYFYINWDGNIMPCVFIPYYKDNVIDLFNKGKKIEDALFSDFYVKARGWQSKYYDQNGKLGNMLRPCFIRDHHKEFVEIAKETNVLPENLAAREAMEDEKYHKKMIDFDEKLKKLEDPFWEKEYAE